MPPRLRIGSALIKPALLGCLALLPFSAALQAAPAEGDSTSLLRLAGPVKSWDEGLPLGNGLTGGLLWGGDGFLNLSLDRGDLWDERRAPGVPWQEMNYATLLRLKTEGKVGEMNRIMDAAYHGPYPTKLPGGRIVFRFAEGVKAHDFRLDARHGEGRVALDGPVPGEVRAFFSATAPVALLKFPSGSLTAADVLTPAQVEGLKRGADSGPSSGGGVAKLGYPVAAHGAEGDASWYLQEAADGLKYCVMMRIKRDPAGDTVAVTVTSTDDDADPVTLAKTRTEAALKSGYDAGFEKHAAWWENFSGSSSVTVPDPDIQRIHDLARYFYGAASRRGAPPIPLQGVWTCDNGALPPWKGDYHNDLNTQLTYLGYQAAGLFDEGAAYLDMLWNNRATYRRFTKEFYGTDGATPPGVMTLKGEPLGGWGQYSLSPTMGAWSAHLFYLHWRYTVDDAFLRDRAYPWCKDVGICLKELLRPDASGKLVLPLSSSPEAFDNSGKAWLKPNSNYDLMSARMLFLALVEMAGAQGLETEAAEWKSLADKLGDYAVNDRDELLLAADTPLTFSHRHLSNLIGLHPFNLIDIEGSDTDRKRIAASLAQWDKLGTRGWCGYSFAWMAGLRARTGDSEGALKNLSIFAKAFVSRNGFHLNGDQTKSGYSGFTYRPFTLEGNFAAMQAVQEMLLQSRSATPGVPDSEVIRLFPAVPASWADASFDKLRAEGGATVSAKRIGGKTVAFSLVAAKAGVIRIRDNFGGRTPVFTGGKVAKNGANFVITVAAGETIRAEFKD